jgi:hypothetical protein
MDAQEFREIIEEVGYETRSYSGRFMYSDECLAFECESGDELKAVAEIVAYCSEEDQPEAVNNFKTAKMDSMGLGVVIYFPRVIFVDEAEPETES